MSTLRTTGETPSRTRRMARVASAIGTAALAGGLAILAACADAPSAPRQGLAPDAPQHATAPLATALLTSPVSVDGLVRDVPLASDLTYTFTVKRSGGTFDFKGTGLKITVPSGAFSADQMTITVKAPKGDVVVYDFGPDGSTFFVPLTLTQSVKGTNFYKLPAGTVLEGAYIKSLLDVSDLTNAASTTELISAVTDAKNANVSFKVGHFSGYMVSTGRSRNSDAE